MPKTFGPASARSPPTLVNAAMSSPAAMFPGNTNPLLVELLRELSTVAEPPGPTVVERKLKFCVVRPNVAESNDADVEYVVRLALAPIAVIARITVIANTGRVTGRSVFPIGTSGFFRRLGEAFG